MRGIFAAGVLDVFLERAFAPFDFAIGSSAGACNLASHLAGQHGRNRRCYLTQMRRTEFIDARRFLRGGHWLDIDYLWDAFDREDPLDVEAATSNRTKLIVATTEVGSGAAKFLEPHAANLSEVLRASSAVPVLYRRFVELDGRAFADGGIAAPIPIDEAYRRGARKIVVVRSRPIGFPGPSRLECAVARMMLRSQAGLATAFRRYRNIYTRSSTFVERPPVDCQILHVAPAQLATERMTRDAAALERDYQQGRAAGEQAIARWNAL
jgi:predicted patatin/cPLA2 family phospholipase